jgi:hypothetical protein
MTRDEPFCLTSSHFFDSSFIANLSMGRDATHGFLFGVLEELLSGPLEFFVGEWLGFARDAAATAGDAVAATAGDGLGRVDDLLFWGLLVPPPGSCVMIFGRLRGGAEVSIDRNSLLVSSSSHKMVHFCLDFPAGVDAVIV